jgi:hypothetical protein
VAGSMGKKLLWRDTGEPVKLDLFFRHMIVEVPLDIQPEPFAYGCLGSRGDCLGPLT